MNDGGKYRQETMRRITYLWVSFAVAILSSCIGRQLGHPMPEEYLGLLSEQYAVEVSETYFGQQLSHAYMDLDGDRQFDLLVNLDDSGRSIHLLIGEDIPIDRYVKDTFGLSHRNTRPKGISPSALLEKIYDASRQPPDLNCLTALYAGKTEETERWLLALRLRTGGEISATTAKEAFDQLVAGNMTMESAFILSGLGEHGLRLLGKAMRETEDKKAARDASIYLSCAGAAAIVSLDDLVASLGKGWHNTRHCTLSAILNVAKEHPEAVRVHIATIREYSSHRDQDIRGKVQLIIDVTEKDSAEQPPASNVPKTSPQD